MDVFVRLEIAAKVVFHDQAMFQNVLASIALASRMIRGVNKHITLSLNLAALPPSAIFSSKGTRVFVVVVLNSTSFSAVALLFALIIPTAGNELHATTNTSLWVYPTADYFLFSTLKPPLT